MKLSVKKENMITKHRFSLFFFVFLLLYHIIIVNRLTMWRINEVVYSTLCADYSFGFASKLLSGSVFRFLFGSHTSRTTANIFAIAVIVLFFAALALVLEKFLLRMPEKYRNTALVLLMFLVTGAYTFSIFTKWVGLMDTAWLWVTLAFLFCLHNKYLIYLTPLFFMLALLVHFSALVFFIPMFSILLLYKAAVAQEKKEKVILLLLFAISIILTIIGFTILMLNESKLICTIDEFHQKLLENGTDYFHYYDYAFYHLWYGKQVVPDSVIAMKPSLMKFVYLFECQFKLADSVLRADPQHRNIIVSVCGLFVLAPLVFAFIRFHIYRMRRGNSLLKRIAAFFMVVQFPFNFVLGILFAVCSDMTRYYTFAFLSSFICVLVVLWNEEKMQILFFEKMHVFRHSLPAKIYFLAYTLIAFVPSI